MYNVDLFICFNRIALSYNLQDSDEQYGVTYELSVRNVYVIYLVAFLN